jgi:putative spermidine/putrescine transport system ATP-binding protein
MAFLDIRNVSKTFSQTAIAVKDFSLEIARGELVSFLGPSGCGKTTTLRMVAGFEMPTSGSIFIKDADVTYMPPNQRNVGMVFQAYALFPNMTVADNIGYGLLIAKKPREEIEQRVKEMLALVHMADFGDRYPHQLSGGQQQRVALARALAVHPEVLLLDEPLSALDAKIRVSLRGEIRMIQKELGITTIYVTHDQEEALSISDRIVVMNAGKIEQIGTPFEIYNYPQTEFIAQFVGTLNAVSAVVKDAAAGVLQLEGRSIKTTQTSELGKNGDRIMIAIRPERLSITTNGLEGNVLEGTVENITFLGAIVRIQVSIDKLIFNIDTFNNPHIDLPAIKQKVRVAFPEEAVMVLKSNQER